MAKMADLIEKGTADVMKVYGEIRERTTVTNEIRRKVDACEAVTKDMLKIIYERLTEVDGDFDAERERKRLRQLHAHDYAHSIYSTASQSLHSSRHSASLSIAAKRADAVAELAAKEVQYKLMEEEIEQKEKIRLMEEQHNKELDRQRVELQRLQVKGNLETARVKLQTYDREIKQFGDDEQLIERNYIQLPSSLFQNPQAVTSAHILPTSLTQQNAHAVTSAPSSDVTCLAKAIQDSIAINRLPAPNPVVFSGDPLLFLEWKASFMSLIDSKGISSADKLFYLKQYISGPAQKCLEGTFYRSDDEAYRDAWEKLNKRYGQPFIVQRAFRDKLSKWPKIQPKDAEGLRAYSDFLNACLQATPHVKGLEILSDCEENQKLIQKIPDWLASRWNRQVTKALLEGKDFPTFKEFSGFVSIEAEISCNPVTSLYALQSNTSTHERVFSKERKGSKVNVFSTQTAVNNDAQGKGTGKPPCM